MFFIQLAAQKSQEKELAERDNTDDIFKARQCQGLCFQSLMMASLLASAPDQCPTFLILVSLSAQPPVCHFSTVRSHYGGKASSMCPRGRNAWRVVFSSHLCSHWVLHILPNTFSHQNCSVTPTRTSVHSNLKAL